jgi:hypothetical protein
MAYSRRRSEPTSPHQVRPVVIPARNGPPGNWSSSIQQRTARSSWCSCRTGAPKGIEQAPLVTKIDLTKMTAPPVDGSHGLDHEVLQPVNGL